MIEITALEITALGHNGEGVGTLPDGLKVFVDGALPQELISCTVTERKKSYAIANLNALVETSPHRVPPPCPHFSSCGGCSVQHLDYREQLTWKRQRVYDALCRIAKFEKPLVDPCQASVAPFGYRNKIQMPVDSVLGLGLYEKKSHRLVPINACAIHCKEGEAFLHAVVPTLRPFFGELRHVIVKSAQKQLMLICVTKKGPSAGLKKALGTVNSTHSVYVNINKNDGNAILSDTYVHIGGPKNIEERLFKLRFSRSPASFFQVNPNTAELLYSCVLEKLRPTCRTVIDAFCGVGTLSCIVAHRVEKVIGIECVPFAIEDAKKNARLNALDNVEFYCGLAQERIADFFPCDAVICNPPRKGCEKSFIDALTLHKPAHIIYVSCDPASLARDLRWLCDGGYRLESVSPVDMFPQTMHVETVVSLLLQ